MFSLFEVLFIATKKVCLQNIELKYQKLPLFWKARNRFSALPAGEGKGGGGTGGEWRVSISFFYQNLLFSYCFIGEHFSKIVVSCNTCKLHETMKIILHLEAIFIISTFSSPVVTVPHPEPHS